MQGCSRKLHPLFHGLTGNTSGDFTPVVALKYYATWKISARIICQASRKEVTRYVIQNVQLTVLQKVVIALSLKEGNAYMYQIVPNLGQSTYALV